MSASTVLSGGETLSFASSRSLDRRLSMLEERSGGFKPYIAMLQRVGQSQDEARAEYEAKNGPLPDDADVMFIRLIGVKPRADSR